MKVVFTGNGKLGSRCATVSRPVGDTCPKSCVYLGDGCYAERTEKMRPNVRASAMGNLISDRHKIRSALRHAASIGIAWRWQVSGDFVRDGKLDLQFIEDIRWAIDSIVSKGGELPTMWVYTHVYSAEIAKLAELGVAVYASIHSLADYRKARKAGFRLFALGCLDSSVLPVHPRGKAERVAKWRSLLPRWVSLFGARFLVCPNQKFNGVTCTGSLDSKACRWCVEGRGNVVFAKH